MLYMYSGSRYSGSQLDLPNMSDQPSESESRTESLSATTRTVSDINPDDPISNRALKRDIQGSQDGQDVVSLHPSDTLNLSMSDVSKPYSRDAEVEHSVRRTT